MSRNPGRHSQTTSPAVTTQNHVDEWDNQLMHIGNPTTGSVVGSPGARRPSSNTNALPPNVTTHHNNNAATTTTTPPVGAAVGGGGAGNSANRFIQEQMIRAAVSAMIQMGVPNVSPGMLELRHRSDQELTQMVGTLLNTNHVPGHSGPGQRCSTTHIEREIYFDPQLISSPSDGRYNAANHHGGSRPHAPLGAGGGNPRTPGGGHGLAYPSPAATGRFSTPATSGGAGQHHLSSTGTLSMDQFAASPAPAGLLSRKHRGGGAGGAGGDAATANHTAATNAAATQNNNNNTTKNAVADDGSDGSQSNAVKPKPHRAPYDPRFLPSTLYDDLNVRNVRRHVARSASSAFSQHSTQSSQLTAPNTRNLNLSEDNMMFVSSSQ